MVKKILFISLALFALLFSGMAEECFADVSAQLEQAEAYVDDKYYEQAEKIYETIIIDYPGSDYALNAQQELTIVYIRWGKGAQALATLDKLIADFPDHPGLPRVLFNIALQYRQSKRYEKAKVIYQQIIQQYPDSPYAGKAQVGISETKVWSLIESGNDTAAQTALDGLIADFPDAPDLPAVLYDIAKAYEESRKYEQAKNICQQIIHQCPDSPYAGIAQVGIPMMNVLFLIDSGNDAEAKAVIDKLTADFTGHSDLPAVLYYIAKRYGVSGKYKEAESIYQDIVTDSPGTYYALHSQRRLVCLYISVGNDAAAQAALDSLIADFSEHSDLLEVLYGIAGKYESSRKYDEAKSIYQQITRRYADSSYPSKAQLDVPRMDILFLIEAGDDAHVNAAIDTLIADFNDHPALPEAIFRVGEQYYNEAFRMEKEGLDAKAKDHFTKAAAVWERIITKLPSSAPYTAHAYNFSADCYRRLGQHEKSIEYYQRVVDDWPDYEYAWDALFRIGRNYEELKKSGLMSKSEADPKIRAAYEQLLEKYPNCKAARYAQRWLGRHNSK